MKMLSKLLCIYLSIVAFTISLYATSYYVDPFTGNDSNNGSYSTPWKTLKAVQDSQTQFANGDYIFLHVDGRWFPGMELVNSDGTKGCNFVIPTGVIKIAPYTRSGYSGAGDIPEIWGTVPINGNWTFAWDGYKNEGYIEHSTLGPWIQYSGDASGETYYKISRAVPQQLWDDFSMMTPVVTPANATTISIQRGQFTYIDSYTHSNLSAYNDCLFFRSSSGEAPSERNIHASAVNLKNKNGLIEAHNVSNRCYIIDIGVTGAHWQGGYAAGIAVTGNSNLVQIIRCKLWRNNLGAQFMDTPWYNCMIKDSDIEDNYSRGVGIQGNIQRIEINNCYFDKNGRRPIFWPAEFTSSADDDSIGIGQQGCDATAIIIKNCIIYNSGEEESSNDAAGSGIYLGTSESCDVDYIEISDCTIYDSHGWGIHISLDGCDDGLISGNTLKYNVNAHKNKYHASSKWFAPVKTGKCDFIDNTVENNYSQFAGVNINHPVEATDNTIKNNKSAYNDASFPWWGEVVLESWTSSGIFNYNTIGSTTDDVIMKHCGLGSYYKTEKSDYTTDSNNSTNDIWQ
jgi:hypothetical protein